MGRTKIAIALLAAAALSLAWWWLRDRAPDGVQERPDAEQWTRWSESEASWGEMLAVEERIRALEPDLVALSNAMLDLDFPDARTRPLFADPVRIVDVTAGLGAPDGERLDPQLGVVRSRAIDATERVESPASIALWREPLSEIAWFENAKFKLVRGEFVDGGYDRFVGRVKFVGTARDRSGETVWLRTQQDLSWQRSAPRPAGSAGGGSDGEEERWEITAWKTVEFDEMRAAKPLFEEVLDSAIPDPAALHRARESLHEQIVRNHIEDPASEVPEFFFAPAMDRHPGLAVVDIDGDGFDDLYVMERHGRNQLFRNRGDGTFEEIAAELGLDLDGRCSSALFADFDNDGDPDVVIGRTLERSVYLENRDGRFVSPLDEDSGTARSLWPHLASSVSAVDFDADGLLDVYIATYAARLVSYERAGEILAPYLEPDELRQLMALRGSEQSHRTMNLFGPPNTLLRNTGSGRFERVDDDVARSFMNTYQATWSDYDRDGDLDVYLSNDFGPNQLLRNDAGRFRDVTDETGTADIGFGMGASWGDFDDDGRPDLYVSNMYSSAGRRITERLDQLDPAYRKMAGGNTLFKNGAAGFTKVSGLAPSKIAVEAAGWSWGGQLTDFDNDGDLDVIALSGYYSAPVEYAVPVDT